MNPLHGVKVVTVCSSSKFYDVAKRVAKDLNAAGLTVYTPRFDYDEEVMTVGTQDKMNLTHEFLGKISRSDAIYVIAEGGYTGRSVCIETGFAFAQKKAVILSEPATEGAIRALTTAVARPDELVGLLAADDEGIK